MNRNTKKSLLIIGAILLFLAFYYQHNLCDCKAKVSYENNHLNEGINLDSLYIPIDSIMLKKIHSSWANFQRHSDSFRVKTQFKYAVNRDILVLEHFAEGAKHYGAILQPTNYDPQKKYRVFVWVNGLNQADPSVQVRHSIINLFISRLTDYFVIIPSFRGQALVLNQKRYCSDGFFGDAFDGATDDALRLLTLTLDNFHGASPHQVTVGGMSRGGTVALLMGARDTTIKNIVSIAGPTDFYAKEVYQRYGFQYKYQFLSTTKSIDTIRQKMLKSSPIYFIDNYPNPLLLIHGKNDRVVPISNATQVIELLTNKKNFTSIINDNGHAFYDWNQVIEWIEKNN